MPTFAHHRPDAAGVYRFLKAMEDRGLVSSAWDLSASGPAKRLFDLTNEGKACLARWVVTLEQYRAQIGQLIQSLHFPASRVSRVRCGCGRKAAPKPSAGKKARPKAVSK